MKISKQSEPNVGQIPSRSGMPRDRLDETNKYTGSYE
jgi:hypothetical protein